MRLVVVTQQVDPASPVLGATVDKLRALATRVDELVVLADAAVEGVLPANCRVRLFRATHRAGRGIRFETALARELARGPRPAAVLAHMRLRAWAGSTSRAGRRPTPERRIPECRARHPRRAP